jgi:ribosome modulation factor
MEPQSGVGLGIIFAAGYDAGITGEPRSVAPGPPGSDCAWAWLVGWGEARSSVLPAAYPAKKALALD